ncbi:M48 family metallopeptidase [Tepidibacter mesophilus]|uniref:M48 family metallopeptidase n=1 Tax=Tepidibacter mesophilus TaxID=655607 RepID=UPI000C0732BA|nr:M48 family metallopeptidase [Tepidibacter mesophilus]
MKQQSKINVYYLGKTYPLYTKVDVSIKKVIIEWDGKAFICTSPQEGEIDIANAIKLFYTKASKKLIEERLKLYQPQFKVKYKSFSIESHQNKWGSCSSKRHLTFHWKLIMFPLNAIDYVVVHELCHLIHMNHDRSFWRLVGKVYPKYKEVMDILGTEKTR